MKLWKFLYNNNNYLLQPKVSGIYWNTVWFELCTFKSRPAEQRMKSCKIFRLYNFHSEQNCKQSLKSV